MISTPLKYWKAVEPLGVGLLDEVLQVVVVGGEQHQRAEARRADGIALGDRLGRVADGVERVRRAAHLLRQARHLGDAAGVVGHRAEGVERDDDAGETEHGRGGDRRAEEAGEVEGDEDAGDDDQRRQRGRLERDGEALDDVGAVAGDRGLADRAHRAVADAGVVLGDPDDEAGHREADEAAQEQAHAGDDETRSTMSTVVPKPPSTYSVATQRPPIESTAVAMKPR